MRRHRVSHTRAPSHQHSAPEGEHMSSLPFSSPFPAGYGRCHRLTAAAPAGWLPSKPGSTAKGHRRCTPLGLRRHDEGLRHHTGPGEHLCRHEVRRDGRDRADAHGTLPREMPSLALASCRSNTSYPYSAHRSAAHVGPATAPRDPGECGKG